MSDYSPAEKAQAWADFNSKLAADNMKYGGAKSKERARKILMSAFDKLKSPKYRAEYSETGNQYGLAYDNYDIILDELMNDSSYVEGMVTNNFNVLAGGYDGTTKDLVEDTVDEILMAMSELAQDL